MASREVKEREIAGQVYKVTLLGAKQGRAMSVRLLKLIGPTLSSFVEGTVHGSDGAASIAIGAADAVRELAKHMSAEELAAISDELAKFTTVVIDAELEPQLFAIFDDHFAGRYDAMVGWLAFAIEANFASFLGGSANLGALLGKVKAAIESVSKFQRASTGTSGASQPVGTSAQA
jgi:hypothetical protein